MATFKSEIVFVRILFPYMIGIMLMYPVADYFSVIYFIPSTLLFFILHILANIFYRRFSLYNFKNAIGLSLYVYILLFGGLTCLLYKQQINDKYFGNKNFNQLKVSIDTEPQKRNGIQRFEANVNTGYSGSEPSRATGRLLIAVQLDSILPISLNYGDELLISCNYQPVEPAYNPGEFNFKDWLAAKNVYHQTLIHQDHIQKLKTIQANSIVQYAIEVRQQLVKIYRKLLKSDEAFAVASTLVLGYRADLSKETLAAYSKTGTIHALSVSGMHVGIIYILLNWLLSFLDKNKILKILKILIICTLIWYYSLITGFSPSVLRSAVMLTVFILAKGFHRNSNPYNILAFTAFCLLAWNPFLIWDLGFELSFLAVVGLIYLHPKIYKWIYVKNKWLDKLWSTVALSLAAQVTTFPLSIYYFHQFPIYFIFSNLFILLPVSIMMYLGISILLFRLYTLAPIFEWIITFTNNGLKWISNLPFSGINGIWINELQLIILSIALTVLLFAFSKLNKRLLIITMSLFLVFGIYRSFLYISHFRQKEIIFFSLRKNFAAAFISGTSAVLVTDLQLTDRSFDFFVKPALEKLKVRHIDLLSWELDTILMDFVKKNNQIVFHNYRLLLVDMSLNNKRLANLPKFNSVWFHKNPKKKIEAIRNEVIFETLIIDATNNDYIIKKYEDEANKFGMHHYTLKKNKAYLIDLN